MKLLWATEQKLLGFFYQMAVFITARRVVVRGTSMYPALSPGEYALFNRLALLKRGPQRRDIVLARVPSTGRQGLIKRVVGVPGDTVQLIRGGVLVNGVPVDEASGYLDEPESSEEGMEWALKEDEYFLLGDAWEFSTDSRSFGPIPRKAINAKAWLVYWPVSQWRRLDTPS